MMARRLCPRPTGGSPSNSFTPRPSGPRCVIESVMRASSARTARPRVPQMPHIGFLRLHQDRDVPERCIAQLFVPGMHPSGLLASKTPPNGEVRKLRQHDGEEDQWVLTSD